MRQKQVFEDFMVEEIPTFELGNGRHCIFLLEKRNCTTERAVEMIADALHLKRNRVGYAGIKDRHAITKQYISISDVSKEKVESLVFSDVFLSFIGFSQSAISVGMLKGNRFRIVVRDLDKNASFDASKKIKNYFDEQRFSNNNAEIGLAILRRDFKKAVELILENKGFYEDKIRVFTMLGTNDYVGALKLVPHKILLLFIHAYQSSVFNKTISGLDYEKNVKIPIVGFGTEYPSAKMEKIIRGIISKDGVSERDFVISQIPQISCEGEMRYIYVFPQNLKVSKLEKDELNKGRYKSTISFELPKGSYATNVIKSLVS